MTTASQWLIDTQGTRASPTPMRTFVEGWVDGKIAEETDPATRAVLVHHRERIIDQIELITCVTPWPSGANRRPPAWSSSTAAPLAGAWSRSDDANMQGIGKCSDRPREETAGEPLRATNNCEYS